MIQPAVIRRAVTGFQASANILARLDDVLRIKRVIAHSTANGAASVQRRCRAAQDLDALDDLRVHVVAMGVGKRALEKVVRHFYAVHLSQDSVPVDAANVVTAGACSLAGTAHGNARLIAYQITNRIDVSPIQRRTVLHRHRTGHRID